MTKLEILESCINNNELNEAQELLINNPELLNQLFTNGKSVLHLAAETKNLRLIAFLLEQPQLDIYLKTHDGKTAIEMANHHNHADLATEIELGPTRYREWLYAQRRLPSEGVFKLYLEEMKEIKEEKLLASEVKAIKGRMLWSDVVSDTHRHNEIYILENKIITKNLARLEKLGYNATEAKEMLDRILVYLKENTALVMTSNANSLNNGMQHNKLMNIFERENLKLAGGSGTSTAYDRLFAQAKMNQQLAEKTQDRFNKNREAGHRYAALMLLDDEHPLMPLSEYGRSFIVFKDLVKLNSLFLYGDSLDVPVGGSNGIFCDYHHMEIMLSEFPDETFAALLNKIESGHYPANYQANKPYYIEVWIPDVPLLDKNISFVQHIHIDSWEYKATQDELQSLERSGVHVSIGNNPFPVMAKMHRKALAYQDRKAQKDIERDFPLLGQLSRGFEEKLSLSTSITLDFAKKLAQQFEVAENKRELNEELYQKMIQSSQDLLALEYHIYQLASPHKKEIYAYLGGLSSGLFSSTNELVDTLNDFSSEKIIADFLGSFDKEELHKLMASGIGLNDLYGRYNDLQYSSKPTDISELQRLETILIQLLSLFDSATLASLTDNKNVLSLLVTFVAEDKLSDYFKALGKDRIIAFGSEFPKEVKPYLLKIRHVSDLLDLCGHEYIAQCGLVEQTKLRESSVAYVFKENHWFPLSFVVDKESGKKEPLSSYLSSKEHAADFFTSWLKVLTRLDINQFAGLLSLLPIQDWPYVLKEVNVDVVRKAIPPRVARHFNIKSGLITKLSPQFWIPYIEWVEKGKLEDICQSWDKLQNLLNTYSTRILVFDKKETVNSEFKNILFTSIASYLGNESLLKNVIESPQHLKTALSMLPDERQDTFLKFTAERLSKAGKLVEFCQGEKELTQRLLDSLQDSDVSIHASKKFT